MFVVLPSLAAENQVSTPSPAASRFTPLDPFEQVKQMGRGVNILGYDPICATSPMPASRNGIFRKSMMVVFRQSG